jgi:FixJ family two-component response regulator
VLLVSGYTDRAVPRQDVQAAGWPFLEKPYSPAALARKIRELLDADPVATTPAHHAHPAAEPAVDAPA